MDFVLMNQHFLFFGKIFLSSLFAHIYDTYPDDFLDI